MILISYSLINLFSLIINLRAKVRQLLQIGKHFVSFFMFLGMLLTFIKRKEVFISEKSISLRDVLRTTDLDHRQKMTMRKVLTILCFGILLLGSCKRETKDERFRREYEQFTLKECPKDMNPYTRMDSICYDIKSRTLTEYYTVSDFLDDDSLYTEEVIEDYRTNLLKELKGSIQMKPYKDESINFSYLYRSITSGKVLLEVTFTPEDYSK